MRITTRSSEIYSWSPSLCTFEGEEFQLAENDDIDIIDCPLLEIIEISSGTVFSGTVRIINCPLLSIVQIAPTITKLYVKECDTLKQLKVHCSHALDLSSIPSLRSLLGFCKEVVLPHNGLWNNFYFRTDSINFASLSARHMRINSKLYEKVKDLNYESSLVIDMDANEVADFRQRNGSATLCDPCGIVLCGGESCFFVKLGSSYQYVATTRSCMFMHTEKHQRILGNLLLATFLK